MGWRVLRPSAADPIQIALPPLLATSLCWYSSPNEITTLQAALAFLLLIIPWSSYLIWRHAKRREVPLFAMIAVMHWVYFAQPLYWGDRRLPGGASEAPQDLITATLAMALIGVVCLWLGMRTHIELSASRSLPDITDSPMTVSYTHLTLPTNRE